MNILDENLLKTQRQLLRSWRIPVRQIGHDIGRKGLLDEAIVPLFDTQAKRVGAVIRVSHRGILVWHLHAEEQAFFDWAP